MNRNHLRCESWNRRLSSGNPGPEVRVPARACEGPCCVCFALSGLKLSLPGVHHFPSGLQTKAHRRGLCRGVGAPEPKGEASPHLESKHPWLGTSSFRTGWGGGRVEVKPSRGKAWDPETRTTDPANKKTGCLDHGVTVASGESRGH